MLGDWSSPPAKSVKALIDAERLTGGSAQISSWFFASAKNKILIEITKIIEINLKYIVSIKLIIGAKSTVQGFRSIGFS